MPNKYLEKIAAKQKKESLLPHQASALDKLDQSDGIVMDHSTGGGKTKSFLTAVERSHAAHPDNQALIIAPASLVTNIDKEIKKHGLKIDPKRLTVMSYEKAVIEADNLSKTHFHTVIMDEAHKLRNPDTKRVKTLRDIAERADKRILATASSVYNHPADIAPLINIAAGKKVLPENKRNFEHEFIDTVEEYPSAINRYLLGMKPHEYKELKNRKYLGQVFKKYVHHYNSKNDPAMAAHFPTTTEKIIPVPMSKEQVQVYGYLEKSIPWITRMKIERGLPLDKQESANLNAFSSGVRQASNSVKPFVENPDKAETTPKIKAAVHSLREQLKKNPRFKGVVYSNYLKAGVLDYSNELTKHKIPHTVFTGALNKTQKDQAVADYNSGKTPVMLISGAGSEGLDLKGTRLMQILEPHFNAERITQAKGRGVRFDSHKDLPVEERHVDIEHYMSSHPDHWLWGKAKKKSIDQYLFALSGQKHDLGNQVKDLMEKNSSFREDQCTQPPKKRKMKQKTKEHSEVGHALTHVTFHGIQHRVSKSHV